MFCFYFIIGYYQKGRVSLYARLTKNVALGTTQTVIFDDVVTNNWHAYNKHTSHFTAPRHGTYYFATSFVSGGGGTHLQMMKNDQEIGRGVAYPGYKSTGSINVIFNLKKGDVVLVRHLVSASGETILGYRYSEFVGHILSINLINLHCVFVVNIIYALISVRIDTGAWDIYISVTYIVAISFIGGETRGTQTCRKSLTNFIR